MINIIVVITAITFLQYISVAKARRLGSFNDDFHTTTSLGLTLDFYDKMSAKAVSCPFQKCQFLEEQIGPHDASRRLDMEWNDRFHESESVHPSSCWKVLSWCKFKYHASNTFG